MSSLAHATKDIKEAARFIEEGRVVGFPTGTSYGLAADTQQGFALQRVRNLKKRDSQKTFTVFMQEKLWDAFLELTPAERKLLLAAKNKPLTLLVTPKENLQHLAQDGRVGLRVIDHPLMLALAESVEVPLTATSANVAGESACRSSQEVLETFPGKVTLSPHEAARMRDTVYDLSLACVLDGGALPQNPPTTIAQLKEGQIEIVREGNLSKTDLESLLKS